MLVVDASIPPGAGDRFVLDLMRKVEAPSILALNKVDRLHKPGSCPSSSAMRRPSPFKAIVPIAALTGDGVAELEAEILSALPDGRAALPGRLPDGSDANAGSRRSWSARRCFATRATSCRSARPSSSTSSRSRRAPGGLTRIFASVLVDHDSQKPIVVGKGGDMIKRIGTEARQDLEEMLQGRVYLDLHVKVRERWRDDERLLREMGIG